MYELYGFAESGHTYKVALALHMANANWQCHLVDFFHGETRTASFRDEHNSMGEVPVLQHNGHIISQSAVILEYLHGKTGNYYGDTVSDAQAIRRWVFWDAGRFSANHSITRFLTAFAPKDMQVKDILSFFKRRNEAAFAILNQHLAHNTWVAAGRFSAADLACCSYLYYPEAFGFDPEAYVHIQAWLERIKNLPGWMHPYDLLPKAYPKVL